MERRKQLTLLVSGLSAIGFGALLVIFTRSMMPTDSMKTERVLTVNIVDIPLDEYRIYEWNGRPLAIFRPGEQSVAYLLELNKVANGPDYERENIPEVFVYEPISTIGRCVLWDSSKNESMWPKYRGWYDPCRMGFWDYSGRNLPGVMAPSNMALPDLKPVFGSYRWISKTTIEFRP